MTMCPMTSRWDNTTAIRQCSDADRTTVWRLSRRSYSPHPHAIHSQGLCHPHSSTPSHHGTQRRVLLLAAIQELDPVEPVGNVGVALWSHRIHAFDVLEEEELPYELGLLGRVYCYGGMFI